MKSRLKGAAGGRGVGSSREREREMTTSTTLPSSVYCVCDHCSVHSLTSCLSRLSEIQHQYMHTDWRLVPSFATCIETIWYSTQQTVQKQGNTVGYVAHVSFFFPPRFALVVFSQCASISRISQRELSTNLDEIL